MYTVNSGKIYKNEIAYPIPNIDSPIHITKIFFTFINNNPNVSNNNPITIKNFLFTYYISSNIVYKILAKV